MREGAGGSDPKRRILDEEVLAWMRETDWQRDDDRFDDLARKVFRHQYEHCRPYRRFASARGIDPDQLQDWREIPAIPCAAFKEAALRSFPAALTCKTFRTSGTTTDARGELQLDTLALYEASLLPTIERHVFPDISPTHARMTIRILAPSPEEAPDSSLSHMFGCTMSALAEGDSQYETTDGKLRAAPLVSFLDRRAESDEAVALLGTAFAFVHLLESMQDASSPAHRIVLPAGSRIMETGGFKGRAREIPRDELYTLLQDHLGVPQDHIVNQYGMTELGSQFYDSVLLETLTTGLAGPRRKLGPPWARVRIVDPETGRDAAPGEIGMIVIHDLANTGSIAALESADLGRQIITGDAREDGFEVLGRSPDAERRWLRGTREIARRRRTRLLDRSRRAAAGRASVSERSTTPCALDVEAAMGRLRENAQDLAGHSLESILDSLAGVLEIWRRADSPYRKELVARLPEASGFGAAMIEEGLSLALADWTGAALRDLVKEELPGEKDPAGNRGHAMTAVVLAGSIPMPSLLACILPLLLRSPTLVKSASRDSVTPGLVARSIAEIDPLLGRCIEVVSFSRSDEAAARAFFAAPCINATGSDETLAQIAGLLTKKQHFIAHGHKTSVAVLGPHEDSEMKSDALAKALAVDISLWDQLGCLSPTQIFVVGDEARTRAEALAEALSRELEAAQERWPRGSIESEAAAAIAHERSRVEMRIALGRNVAQWKGAGTLHTVVL